MVFLVNILQRIFLLSSKIIIFLWIMEETTLNALQHEVDFYRNQSVLEDEIRTVIGDNQKLSQQVGQLLREKLQQAQIDGGEGGELHAQLTLLTKERDSLHVLWQTSQKTIEALENELKAYQSYDTRGQQHNSNEDKRDTELKLETALNDYLEIEKKYKTLQTKCFSLEQDLRGKDNEIVLYKDRNKQAEDKIAELSKTLEECRINFAAEKKNNDELRTQLSVCQKEIVDRVKREAEAKSKVAEALQLFDVVSAQKNEAYKKIKEITGELLQAKQEVASAKRTVEASYRTELDAVRDKYNEKIADMLAHIRNLDTELVEKGMLLNKALREVKVLKEENESYLEKQKDCLHNVNPKLQLAEQRLEAMFQELVASERRNIQLLCEKQSLTIDIQRIQDMHTRETKRRDWEENLLKTQCEELKAQVEHLQKSLEETHGMVNKLQNMLSSRTELSHKMVSTKEEELMELNKHLENQMELSRKWKESYVDMTEKLKKRLEEIQKENNELRKKLKLPSGSSDNNTSS
ncbi:myosin-11-like isoform X2 [Pectinophora gossypiella]|uniref:myosin-11-like isoform X2 n=1 Tax=Pectinophora gossypiella TaxID=13191 RepID=UPI00214E3D56|nr:myosin-11-like isoform X2 [Pectinophora gossypiella]